MKLRVHFGLVLAGLLLAAAISAAGSPALAAGTAPPGHHVVVFSAIDGLSGPPGTPIVLRRATATAELLSWAQSGARRDAIVVLYAADGTSVAKYHLGSAWPSKVEPGTAMNAGSNEVAVEAVVIVAATVSIVTNNNDPDAYVANHVSGTVSIVSPASPPKSEVGGGVARIIEGPSVDALLGERSGGSTLTTTHAEGSST